MTKTMNDEKKSAIKPAAAIWSVLCSIAVGLCWLLRDFEFRGKLAGPGSAGRDGGGWLMMDVNVALRRGMLILAIAGLFLGIRAVMKRHRLFDFLAFAVSIVVAVAVGYVVYKMGGKGFWLN